MLSARQAIGAIKFTRDRLSPEDHAAFVDVLHKSVGGGEDQGEQVRDVPNARGQKPAGSMISSDPSHVDHPDYTIAVDEKQREAFRREYGIAAGHAPTYGEQAAPTRRDRQRNAMALDEAAKAGVETDLSKTDPELFASIARIGRVY
jgi:hypothetical protein